ncbi:putative taurine catabolism dioxygenase [Pseudovirgaria hyperparasitica]|uniref:Putative taurine catabolism dioxygenase n=1 Tax=Pseudovirgaria hyperparasitica TaxID=470096 RepID=A0A6A6VZ58_9PEZI|nr:putative taurine catabolism dioxygenase [Pseudovirgaria hyperparasitica]KAF2755136.1 putative taurine catabolism dioxygenase [Pseudovirgaria hyperparasitica]
MPIPLEAQTYTDSRKRIDGPTKWAHNDVATHNRLKTPLRLTGALKARFTDLTPAIGREFHELSLLDVLNASNRDEIIQDIAVTVSERGVVFFRNQYITPTQMKAFVTHLSILAGCPESSSLHTHPLTEPPAPNSTSHDIGTISSEKQKRGGGLTHQLSDTTRLASAGWHSDISFEPVPSDYAMLRMHTLPPTGGDTLWASGYDVYDRLSAPMRLMFEQGGADGGPLRARHDGGWLRDEARRLGIAVWDSERGSPANRGGALSAVHPVVRTNPVTGWRSVYVNRGFTTRVEGVTRDESDLLLKYLFELVTQNHDLQVRYTWGVNDVALWDNRSTFHCATYDYDEVRTGDRVCSLGEMPYFCAESKSRRAALADTSDLFGYEVGKRHR